MNIIAKHIYKYIVTTLGLFMILCGVAKADLTASKVKAEIDQYEGKKVSFKIPYVRAIPAGPEEEEGLRFLTAETIDEDNRSKGGKILIVATTSKYNSLIRKYGTSVERNGRKPELNSIRGTIKVLNYEDSKNRRDKIYLDLAGDVDLKEIIKARMSEQMGGAPKMGKGKGPGKKDKDKRDRKNKKNKP